MQPEKSMDQDFEIADRAIIYDPETGEIVGSHTLGRQVSETARRRFDSVLSSQVKSLESRLGRRLSVHHSPEAIRLNSLHHSVDLATGELLENPQHAAKTSKVL